MNRLTIAFVLAAGTLCDAASAYEVKRNEQGHPIRWVEDTIVLRVDRSLTERFGMKEALESARQAAAAWSDIEGVPKIQVSAGVAPEFREEERANAIYWLEDWVTEGDELALTYTTSTGEGHVVGSDIIINGSMPYAVISEGEHTAGEFDLVSVLTHEMGHVLGLDHSHEVEATMHNDLAPDAIYQRTLEEDDRRGVQAVYAEEIPEVSTCAYGSSGNTNWGWWAVILSLGTWVARRRFPTPKPVVSQ